MSVLTGYVNIDVPIYQQGMHEPGLIKFLSSSAPETLKLELLPLIKEELLQRGGNKTLWFVWEDVCVGGLSNRGMYFIVVPFITRALGRVIKINAFHFIVLSS